MKIFAHRGYSGKYPENTMAAFQAAAKLPIFGVELDVHLTKDNQIVVIHVETINRTSNGSGFVKDLTLEELRRYDFGSWFGEEFSGEKIPTLSEVLELFCKTKIMVNIELKSDIFVYAGLEEKVLREVEAYGMEDQVIISSFDHEAVRRIAHIDPNVENAALFANMILNVVNYQKEIPAKALHVALPTAVRKSVLEAIQQNSIVRVYTVNEIEHAEILLNIGVDAIFTDEPEKMLNFMKQRNQRKEL